MRVAEALPQCFPLPAWVEVGNQRWTITCSSLYMRASGAILMRLLLSGPYGRFRHVRLTLQQGPLLERQYDAPTAARLMTEWLPYSDAKDLLQIDGAQLLQVSDLPRPADD